MGPESNDDIDPTEVLNDSEKKTVFDSFEQLINDVSIYIYIYIYIYI